MLLDGMQRLTSLDDLGLRIRARINKETHLIVGVGIAQTKTLAKLANQAAKKWTKMVCVLDLSNIDRQRKLLALVPVEDVWDVGRRISKNLMLWE